jgi:hypothetical protein
MHAYGRHAYGIASVRSAPIRDAPVRDTHSGKDSDDEVDRWDDR